MSDWKDIVRSVAPTVASALGGPLAGVAVNVLSSTVLGDSGTGDNKKDLKAISKAVLSGGAEALKNLQQAEFEIKKIEAEREVSFAQIEADDRDSARNREIVTGDKTPMILGIAVFLGFFGILVGLMFLVIPEKSLSPLNIMLGALASIVVQIANYYYGSSKGSSQKNTLIGKMLGR